MEKLPRCTWVAARLFGMVQDMEGSPINTHNGVVKNQLKTVQNEMLPLSYSRSGGIRSLSTVVTLICTEYLVGSMSDFKPATHVIPNES